MVAAPQDPVVEHTWLARKTRPVVALQVVGVFIGFMALAHFVFHSPEAVQALFAACVAALVSLVPGILTRMEYRLAAAGLEKRTASKQKEEEFQEVFRWEEVDRIVPTGAGFKFYKKVEERRPLNRLYKRNLSDSFSGEFQVEKEDRERVRSLLHRRHLLSA